MRVSTRTSRDESSIFTPYAVRVLSSEVADGTSVGRAGSEEQADASASAQVTAM